ncbi:LuxR family two component transcriptional regulator [Actinomycetospora succinea]|uniref:LuxR family two component transcriptional regulator n=1 Tax=Actinomycetospora succinea TaxID=663603 RepID=A0A4R6VE32_9PSEU|nr:response regulator transcription factor [Actinomycetospora succinea]TDQ61073.1 LuxR family two component transcriptional regulator [Actinomycetospora succinea]
MRELRLVLVDDHPLYRSGLRAMTERTAGLACVGEASSGEDALALLAGTACDVVLMDLRMPGMGGVEATRQIAAGEAPPAVLVLTMVEDDEAVLAALRAGARGYVLKGADSDELSAAVSVVAHGGLAVGTAAAAGLVARLDDDRGPAAPFPDLTTQERRVLALLAKGRSTAGIAAELSLSSKTVRNYLSSTYAKLAVTDRFAAIARAREHGLGR